MQETIRINGKDHRIRAGLIAIHDLYKIAGCGNERVFLSREDGLDIPLLPAEYIIVRGGEQFVVGESPLEANPPLRNPVSPEFNGIHDISFPVAKITGEALKKRDAKFPTGRLFADITSGVVVEIHDNMTIVMQDTDSFFVIPSASDDDADSPIDIEKCGQHDRPPPTWHKYRIRIDGSKHTVESAEITGEQILALVGKSSSEWALNQKLHGGKRVRIAPGDSVNFTHPGIERFETVRMQAQQGLGTGSMFRTRRPPYRRQPQPLTALPNER